MSENLPVRWDEKLAAAAKEVAATERPALAAITFRAGQMSYMGTPVPGNQMDVVVIASAFEHVFYTSKFDANRPASPECFSLSLTGEGMVPAPESHERQADACDSCDMFKWKSDLWGGKGKACKERRKFAILPAASISDGNIEKAEMATMSIPVTSVKNWRNYVNTVAASLARPPWAVLTKISVIPDAKTQFQIKFDTVGIVETEYLGALEKRIEMANQILLTPYEWVEPEPAPEPKKGKKY